MTGQTKKIYRQHSKYNKRNGWTNLKKIETDYNSCSYCGFWKLVSLTVFQSSFFMVCNAPCDAWETCFVNGASYFSVNLWKKKTILSVSKRGDLLNNFCKECYSSCGSRLWWNITLHRKAKRSIINKNSIPMEPLYNWWNFLSFSLAPTRKNFSKQTTAICLSEYWKPHFRDKNFKNFWQSVSRTP